MFENYKLTLPMFEVTSLRTKICITVNEYTLRAIAVGVAKGEFNGDIISVMDPDTNELAIINPDGSMSAPLFGLSVATYLIEQLSAR